MVPEDTSVIHRERELARQLLCGVYIEYKIVGLVSLGVVDASTLHWREDRVLFKNAHLRAELDCLLKVLLHTVPHRIVHIEEFNLFGKSQQFFLLIILHVTNEVVSRRQRRFCLIKLINLQILT